MNEKPLERLNYFNGQRLQAADFKLEQEYHMRVRRWLNRSLYTPGIASGLEVYKIEGVPKVKILPGLAIDHLGREIILLEEKDVDVVDHSGGGNGVCQGPYLTIRYQEDVIAQQDVSCRVGGASANKAAWGGPARILAKPVLELNADPPHESSGKIALACITLAKGCTSVETVDTGVRRYVGEASAAKVRQYALEGFRDIDTKNEGLIRFHIRGRQPSSVTLYLRAEPFPTYFYTELGSHSHTFTGDGTSTDGPDDINIPAHSHSLGRKKDDQDKSKISLNTNGNCPPSHTHPVTLKARVAKYEPDTLKPQGNWLGVGIAIGGEHDANLENMHDAVGAEMTVQGEPNVHLHPIVGVTNNCTTLAYPHIHSFKPTGSAVETGANPPEEADVDEQGRQIALKFVSDLQIDLTPGMGSTEVPLTEAVLEQIRYSSSAWDNVRLGDGNDGHVFETKGTGPIRIDLLPGVVLSEGEYAIRLSAPATEDMPRNGGRIHFNLYVE